MISKQVTIIWNILHVQQTMLLGNNSLHQRERRERAQVMSDLNGMLHEGDTISTPPQNGTF